MHTSTTARANVNGQTAHVRRWVVFAVGLLLVLALPARAAEPPHQFVLSPENNHLWAYDAASGERQLVARAVNGPDPGTAAPNGLRRDINGQICVSPDGVHVVAGEDTVLATSGGSSHDPRIAGWGYFDITGSALGRIAITETGKLAPAAGRGPSYNGDPDNYGCGFLDGNRLLTTAIGDTLPGQPATGQLFLWFGPFTSGFQQVTDQTAGVSFFVGAVDHCQIDGALATAGGIAVDTNGDVYITANRPDDAGNPSAVWRYRGQWPRTAAECTAAYLAANIRREAVVPSLPLPVDVRAPTPSSVAISPAGTLVVASVFTGTISEYGKDGAWKRDLYPLSPLAPPQGPLGNTPYGLAFTGDGTLWIADLGIVAAMPAPGAGSLLRLRFDERGTPVLPAQTVAANLTFPDGLGVYTPTEPPAASPATTAPIGVLAVSGTDQRAAMVGALVALVLANSIRRRASTR